ncbi:MULTISPECIES: hypothetical protein [unclassified Curtobacterium]|uniref:hypothetical protein n=1 Tax=unclassified Curtobacterium TaxID=257496 RepID=UPI0037F14402
MSQSTQSGRRDAHRLNRDEAEVRDALLEHSDEKYNGWIFAQLDAAEGRERLE